VEIGVPQCGYCQSGQIMSAAALIAKRKNPTLPEIEAAMADKSLPLRDLSADRSGGPSRLRNRAGIGRLT